MKTVSIELQRRVYFRVNNQVAIQAPWWEVRYPVEVGVWDQVWIQVRQDANNPG